MKKYARMTYAQRCQISALLQVNTSISVIAKQLGFHKTTIYREIKRNTTNIPRSWTREHHPLRAQGEMIDRKQNCRRKIIIDSDVLEKIKSFLYKGWSPELIAGRLRKENVCKITHQTIYRFIKYNPILKQYLLHSDRKRFQYKRRKSMAMPGWWKSIDVRPAACIERSRIGDWERDTMFGNTRKQALLVCTDRMSRYTKIGLIQDLKSTTVAEKTVKLLEETNKKYYTITNDNGVEFKCPDKLPVQVYYCHPHSPQERGTVENTIGVIRRFFPKKSNLDTMNIKNMEDWLNNRPRKVLDFKTPFEVYYNRKVALAP
jgi:IS30 family transposase